MKRVIGIIFATLCLALSTGCFKTEPRYPTPNDLIEVVQPTAIMTAAQTATPTATNTATPMPTLTPTSTLTPTITPTPWEISYFSPGSRRPGVENVHYIADTCQYLEARWNEQKSSVGTIVVPIMFHSVAQPGRIITDDTTISMDTFLAFMDYAKESGYQTITAGQLHAFLTENAKIPELSMILILDDRRPGVTELFLPYLEENNWTLTLAWINAYNDDAIWSRMEQMAGTGLLDVQSHGYNHVYIQSYTPEDVIQEEMTKSKELIEEHFGTIPSAFIWPGGNFTQAAVDLAEEAGMNIGFSAYSRGPLLYNTIPLGEDERQISNPLMVLPRFWSTAAFDALDEGIEVSRAAKAEAELNQESQLQWLNLFCKR
jgi:peptidoglycan/xylan/chitin deacetylase (PgdA/CDA1 family)